MLIVGKVNPLPGYEMIGTTARNKLNRLREESPNLDNETLIQLALAHDDIDQDVADVIEALAP